ncbi:zinc ribbon-containing protein [Ferrimonas balearica]|uniref:zinc ribbon-containing protein n=1 Tax=Ferrimonas balearica TaxID=44012 RepID=UPI001C998E96|nr:zinc ribbon-containing protein [Ferrimonas balearica]MBY5921499.1 zinc ribbon-containing protein [Ferrimonas balearica]MBY5995816.1 zinc ribbon-containing protein [Ferrimonas balearica]
MGMESSRLIHQYEQLLSEIERRYRNDPDLTLGQLDAVLKESRTYLAMESTLSAEQMDLVEQFLRRDLAEYARQLESGEAPEPDSVFTLGLENSIWSWLVEITDRSQMEWHELNEELRHHGTFQAGEVVGLGELVCDNCGHTMSFFHPDTLPKCPNCDGEQFSRRPLEP